MRKKVEHYVGEEITESVISTINLMAMRRYEEGVFSCLFEGVDTLEDLCSWHGALPQQENVVMGEDWVIIYVERKNDIEIVEWLDIEDVSDKFSQTIEMMNAMKEILLSSKGRCVIAEMRHDTSYQFYKKLLDKDFVVSNHDSLELDPVAPSDIEKMVSDVESIYGSLDKYFLQKDRKIDPEIDKYFYHYVSFGITDKFVKRYGKKIGG